MPDCARRYTEAFENVALAISQATVRHTTNTIADVAAQLTAAASEGLATDRAGIRLVPSPLGVGVVLARQNIVAQPRLQTGGRMRAAGADARAIGRSL